MYTSCPAQVLNKISQNITQKKEHSAAQAMLYSLGLSKNDLTKPQIGIGSMWYAGNPCNSKLHILSDYIKHSVNKNKMIPMQFNTIGVSDGISMGTKGMRYSLPSRELIADSFETIMQAQHYDGLVCIPGCDKNLPGSLMGAIRINRPSIIVYGGSMLSNNYKNKRLDIVDAFESFGQYLSGKITEDERLDIVQNSCNKKCGACAGLYTANTMAICLEVLGMTMPNSSSNPSGTPLKFRECDDIGYAMSKLLQNDLKPSDILSKQSFLNAIKMTYIIGGSTNAVIHLLACARTANINITPEDFQKLSGTPILFNMKPHGEYAMHHLYDHGGTSSVIKYLIDNNILDGDVLTVTGKTLKENVQNYQDLNFTIQNVVKPLDSPFKSTGHINILKGNLAPKGCISKIYRKNIKISKKAIVFDSENEMLTALNSNQITLDHFVIIRYQGETIGCPEMLTPTSALIGYFGNDVPPLATDGRFSGGSHGILVAHLEDAYKKNSMTKLIKNDDIISLDMDKLTINLEISDNIKNYRNLKCENKIPDTSGYLKKFAKLCKGFDDGYITV
jgi:dihydroxy-acid dehydratase